MKYSVTTVDATDIDTTIINLDFSSVRLKLMDTEEGLGWTYQQTESAELEYKRFLQLRLLFPNEDIVPNGIVDAFWHQHILDTVAYADDCDKVFGKFLHHDPYFGMADDAEARELISAFERTCDLYHMTFGVDYADIDMAKRPGPKSCRTRCKPVKCK